MGVDNNLGEGSMSPETEQAIQAAQRWLAGEDGFYRISTGEKGQVYRVIRGSGVTLYRLDGRILLRWGFDPNNPAPDIYPVSINPATGFEEGRFNEIKAWEGGKPFTAMANDLSHLLKEDE